MTENDLEKKETEEEIKSQQEKEETVTEGVEGEESLADKLVEAEKQINQYKDLFLRKAAEVENFKRRIENEVSTMIRFSNEKLITELLPIIDDLERSLKASKEQTSSDSFYKGVELIYHKMLKKLSEQGVKPFETVGKKFDVNYHDALMQLIKSDVEPETILQEIEKGYQYHGKVIRHAKVIVAAAPTENKEEQNPSEQK
jgi:molecular chaperone GrpE